MNRTIESAREVFETVADPYYFIDNDDRIVFINARALEMMNRSEAELLGQNVFDAFPAARGTYVVGLFERARRERRVVHEENYSPSLGRWVSVSVHPTSEGLGIRFNDDTKRRSDQKRDQFLMQVDDALRPLNDSDSLTRTAAHMLGELLLVNRCAYADVEDDEDTFNLTGDYNNGVDSIVGRYRFHDFGDGCVRAMRAGVPWIVTDSETDERCARVRESYRATKIRAVICVPIHKAGRFVAAMAVHQLKPRAWVDGDVELMESVASRCWESIERTRLARDLRGTLELLDGITRGTAELIASIDTNYHFTAMNPAFQAAVHYLYGLRVTTGAHVTEAVPGTDGERAVAFWKDALAGESVRSTQDWGVAGKSLTYDVRMFPVRDSAGKVMGAGLIASDITARKREEDAMLALADQKLANERAAREEAERLGRMKDEFLATLSHELRTPLNAILGWTQLLRMGESTPAVRDGLQVIDRNARVQVQLIEDLLDMNRIVSGKLRIEVQRVELGKVLEAALDTMRPTAEAKGVRVENVIASGAVVRGDPARLQQVFWNLLNNAIKFTPRGGKVLVALERVNSHVEVTIGDTGVGIASEFLPFVFERFRQADASSTRAHGGLGLGLSIVKELVELHGGRVRAASEGAGLGASFSVHLPVMAVHDDPHAEPRENPVAPIVDGDEPVISKHLLDGVTVVAVDDEPDASELVRRFLEGAGARVFVAASADEAVGLVQRERPHVIVSDIGMPGRDGYDFIRSIRALPADQGGTTPATALTAFARSEDRRRALLAGFQSHVVKPVEGPELVTVIASLAGKLGP